MHRFPNLIIIPYTSRALHLFKGPPHLLIHSSLAPPAPLPTRILLLPVCVGGTGSQRGRAVTRTEERTGDILGNPSMWLWHFPCEFPYQLLKVTWEGGWVNWGVCASGSTESEGSALSRIPGPCLSQHNPIFKSQGVRLGIILWEVTRFNLWAVFLGGLSNLWAVFLSWGNSKLVFGG